MLKITLEKKRCRTETDFETLFKNQPDILNFNLNYLYQIQFLETDFMKMQDTSENMKTEATEKTLTNLRQREAEQNTWRSTT